MPTNVSLCDKGNSAFIYHDRTKTCGGRPRLCLPSQGSFGLSMTREGPYHSWARLGKKLTYLSRHRTNLRCDTQRMREGGKGQGRINKNVRARGDISYDPTSK